MATLECRNGTYRVVFRHAGRRFSRSLKTRNHRAGLAALASLEDNLERVERGLLEVPSEIDIANFLLSGGRAVTRPRPAAVQTLGDLLDVYFDSFPLNSVETNTILGMRVHARHFGRLFGRRTFPAAINLAEIQIYIDRRATEKGIHGTTVNPRTIKKEIVTLSMIWRWAVDAELLPETTSEARSQIPQVVRETVPCLPSRPTQALGGASCSAANWPRSIWSPTSLRFARRSGSAEGPRHDKSRSRPRSRRRSSGGSVPIPGVLIRFACPETYCIAASEILGHGS